jgi:hypothetical protein
MSSRSSDLNAFDPERMYELVQDAAIALAEGSEDLRYAAALPIGQNVLNRHGISGSATDLIGQGVELVLKDFYEIGNNNSKFKLSADYIPLCQSRGQILGCYAIFIDPLLAVHGDTIVESNNVVLMPMSDMGYRILPPLGIKES